MEPFLGIMVAGSQMNVRSTTSWIVGGSSETLPDLISLLVTYRINNGMTYQVQIRKLQIDFEASAIQI